MRTGDGLMLRLTPIAPMPAAAWAELADVAEGLGNGLIDLTLRGAVQVRGLRDETVAAAQARLSEAGFVESRPVLATDPLGPDDPQAMGNSHAMAARLAALLTTQPLPPGLPPKVTVALDATGRLDQLTADLRLRWVGVDRLWLIVGDRVVAECRADAGPALVRDYLERMARVGCRGDGRRGRSGRHRSPPCFSAPPPRPHNTRHPFGSPRLRRADIRAIAGTAGHTGPHRAAASGGAAAGGVGAAGGRLLPALPCHRRCRSTAGRHRLSGRTVLWIGAPAYPAAGHGTGGGGIWGAASVRLWQRLWGTGGWHRTGHRHGGWLGFTRG
jgi:hypothetical protein